MCLRDFVAVKQVAFALLTAGFGAPLLAQSEEPPLPTAFEAGWKGKPVCEVLTDKPSMRVAKCTFAPGEGHERHSHLPHWGYILEGSTMRITSGSGTVVRELKAGSSWWSDGIAWHEAVNIGQTTGVYLIVEPRGDAALKAVPPNR